MKWNLAVAVAGLIIVGMVAYVDKNYVVVTIASMLAFILMFATRRKW